MAVLGRCGDHWQLPNLIIDRFVEKIEMFSCVKDTHTRPEGLGYFQIHACAVTSPLQP